MNGWIKLHKRIRKHWLWNHPDYFMAWIDMLMMANWEDRKKIYKMELNIIKRGEFPASLRKLGERWGWSVGKVRRFIKLLKTDTMIDTQTEQGFTVIKIRNYDQYQVKNRHTDGHTDGTLTDTTIRSNKNIQEVKKESARVDFEFQKELFDKLRERFGLLEDHYPAYRHHIESMIFRWKDKTGFLVDVFLSDSESEIMNLRYLCEQGIDKYAAPKRKKMEFKKTPLGEFVAYCKKCGQQLFFPNKKSLKTSSSCHAADLVATRPTNGIKHAKKTKPQNISTQP